MADVLRRCKTLAFRLDYEPLAVWVDQELDGYADAGGVPDYRKISVGVRGRFSGWAVGGWMTTEADIGRTRLPEQLAEAEDHLFTHTFTQGVASLEDLLRGDESEFSAPWAPEAAATMTNRVLEHFQCEAAWRRIPRGAVAGVLNTVRNRILSFALAIERASPGAGDVAADEPPALPRDQVAEIAQITIYGGHNVFAVGPEATVSDVRITANDWGALRQALERLGFQPDDLAALPDALAKDGVVDAGAVGPETQGWLDRAVRHLRSGAGAVAPEIAGNTAAGLILQYLGVG